MTMNAKQRIALQLGLLAINSEEMVDQLAAAQARIAELEANNKD